MIPGFWSSLGSTLTQRWVSGAGPAVVFWVGGILAWMLSRGGWVALDQPATWLAARPAPVQLAIIILGLLAATASALVVERTTLPVLRLLQGYWNWPLSGLRERLRARVERRASRHQRRWEELAPAVQEQRANSAQIAEFERLEEMLRRLPVSANQYLPTRLGNILHAAERRPTEKYGLDAVVVWPQLWLCLPAVTQQELANARLALDRAVAAVIWGALFVLFTLFTPWAIVVSVGVVSISWAFWLPQRATAFADLIEATFDVHRIALYSALRWPLPANPADEPDSGRLLTQYIMRGLRTAKPAFTNPTDGTHG
jgi:hypothetical protein